MTIWLPLTLADARALALDKRHAVDVEKRDPAGQKRTERKVAKLPAPPPAPVKAVFSFADLAKLHETFAKGKKKTWADDVAKVKRYLIHAWGTMPLRDVTRTGVHELLDTLVAKGMTVGVNRIQAVISRLFTVALDRSLVDAHPAARMIKRFKEQPSDRVPSDDELRALWAGLDARPGRAADALRLRLLLGQRGEEIVGMKWAEIDFKAKTWDLPGVRTKNRRPHCVPLPSTALAILERRRTEVPPEESRVFPGLTAWADDYRALSAIHGGAYEWKDFRRTVSTRLAARGFSEEVIGRRSITRGPRSLLGTTSSMPPEEWSRGLILGRVPWGPEDTNTVVHIAREVLVNRRARAALFECRDHLGDPPPSGLSGFEHGDGLVLAVDDDFDPSSNALQHGPHVACKLGFGDVNRHDAQSYQSTRRAVERQ